MSSILAADYSRATNVATIDALGGMLLCSGGGNIASPPVVTVAGSSDCVLTLFNGTSNSATPIASFPVTVVGQITMPTSSFTALYAELSGTTAPTVQVEFTGNAA